MDHGTTERAKRVTQEQQGPVNEAVSKLISTHVKSYTDLPDTFQINFPTSDEIITLHFHRFKGFSHIKDFESNFVEFYKLLTDDDKGVSAEWAPFKKLPAEEMVAAFTMHFYSAPPTKISIPHAFALCANPGIVEQILTRIDLENSASAGLSALSNIKNAKKKPQKILSGV